MEHEEGASRGECEVTGADVEMECEGMGTGDEGHEVRRLTREELGICHQYGDFTQFGQELGEGCPVLVIFMDLRSGSIVLGC